MTTPETVQLFKLKSDDVFESLCSEFLNAKYKFFFNSYGRNGQLQNGIDIYGLLPNFQNKYIVAQCKNYFREIKYDSLKNRIYNDLLAANKQNNFNISTFYVMTAMDRDTSTQNYIVEMNKVYNFRIEIVFWEDLQNFILADDRVLKKYYPFLFFNETQLNKVALFELAFVGMQFSRLICEHIFERNITKYYCNIVENGLERIKNNKLQICIDNLLKKIYYYIEGDIPLTNNYNWELKLKKLCKDIESYIDLTCSSGLSENDLPYFLLGHRLAYYDRVLNKTENTTSIIKGDEEKLFLNLCKKILLTGPQLDNILKIFSSMTKKESTSLENDFNSSKLLAPIEIMDCIRNYLIYR